MSKKIVFYLILLSGLILGLIGFFAFVGQPKLRTSTIILTALFYFSWGMVYHYQDKSLHPKVVLEYLLMAILGSVLLLSITW